MAQRDKPKNEVHKELQSEKSGQNTKKKPEVLPKK